MQPLNKSDPNYKYWLQRYRLFSKWDEGIVLDDEMWYSVTPEKIAKHIAERSACGIVVDGFCGAGGNTIQFAKTCQFVIAIDIDPVKIAMARHNASIYGVLNKIQFIVGDFFQIITRIKADVIFLSPPWGGRDYKESKKFSVQDIHFGQNGTLQTAFHISRSITPNVILFVPKTSDRVELAHLTGIGSACEIEKNVVNGKLKTITAYYGALINPKVLSNER